jgi:hypothetical protein
METYEYVHFNIRYLLLLMFAAESYWSMSWGWRKNWASRVVICSLLSVRFEITNTVIQKYSASGIWSNEFRDQSLRVHRTSKESGKLSTFRISGNEDFSFIMALIYRLQTVMAVKNKHGELPAHLALEQLGATGAHWRDGFCLKRTDRKHIWDTCRTGCNKMTASNWLLAWGFPMGTVHSIF